MNSLDTGGGFGLRRFCVNLDFVGGKLDPWGSLSGGEHSDPNADLSRGLGRGPEEPPRRSLVKGEDPGSGGGRDLDFIRGCCWGLSMWGFALCSL